MCFFFLIKILFLYWGERERESTSRGAWQAEGGEADFPLSREPDAGLNLRTLRS